MGGRALATRWKKSSNAGPISRQHSTSKTMSKFKVVLTVINEDSVSPFVVGPRFRRGRPLPMETLYAERGGYWFDPVVELELAQECAEAFTKYASQTEEKKRKK